MLVEEISISKDRLPRRLIIFQVVFILCFLFLIDILHFPSSISYLTDIIWIMLFILIIINRQKIAFLKFYRNWILLFFAYTMMMLIINQQSLLLYLWGLRNNFRFYVFFLACVLFLKSKDINSILKIMIFFYYINFFLCLYQYYALDKHGDALGGIFGVQQGCNSYLNLFLVIICTYQTLNYICKKVSFIKCASVIAIACYLAALSELKIFFVEIIAIVILTVLFTRFSWRKLVLIASSVLILILAINVLFVIFPQWRNYFTFDSIYRYATDSRGYTGAGDLNRLTAITQINRLFFNNSLSQQIFGFGLGSCEYSSKFEFLTSHFYNVYNHLHYIWLSNAWTYLETGYVGLLFFNGFFILSFLISFRVKSRFDGGNVMINLARIVAVCCIIMAIYNVSLRVECGYLAYFILSIPLILYKDKNETNGLGATDVVENESVFLRKQLPKYSRG